MPDAGKTESEKNVDSIEQEEATEKTPRGNVHSEAEDDSPDHEPPPPLPH